MYKPSICRLPRISALFTFIFLSDFSASAAAAFPVDLRGQTPESVSAVINANKPAGAGTATVTLTTYDADFPGEGELVINGNAPVALFGAAGVNANDQNSAIVSINTPASYWKNGSNTLLFKHTSTQGFVVDDAKVSFNTATASTTSAFPADLRGQAPESVSAVINANKPAGAGTATVTLTTYDADFPGEGELVINGNAPVALFGAAGVNANDQNSAIVSINTPASYWKNGSNTLLFKHTSTQGFVVDDAKVSFNTATASTTSAFPADLRGQTPESVSAVINANKPAGAGTATVTLTTYDADFPGEGELVINGNAPVALFGAAGVNANDQNSAIVSINTPASYWKNGSNTLLFKHTSTQGFVVDDAKVSFNTATASATSAFPADLRGQTPESVSAVINANKPAGAGTATVTLTTYDADFPGEGELVINGNAPVALFGAAGVNANDQNSAIVSINTPASYWKNGSNTLLFKHTSTQGFVVDDAKVSFNTATASTTSAFPADLRGQTPESVSAVINANKPAGAGTATVTLTTYDADFPGEGELVINGNAPVALFGAAGVNANDQNSAIVSINTPASYWKNGSNTLLFKHTSTQGFVVDDAKVSFNTATVSSTSASSGGAFALADLPNTLFSSGLSSSGPIVLNGQHNAVISGLHVTNPNGNCIEIRNGSSNITIKNSVIGPCGSNGINIISSSSHVTVSGNYIHDVLQEGVRSYESHNIIVDSNMIEDVKTGYGMWTTGIGNLSFTNNFVKNVHRGNVNGGNVVSVAFVHAKGIRIADNVGVNSLGASDTEDLIGVYKSDGTSTDPIKILNNKFYGSGSSKSGGGILLGDGGGSYQEARNNILVNPGQYGIGIDSGHHNVLSGNKVFSDPAQAHANIGISIGWTAGQNGLECYSLQVSNNEITWWKGSDFGGGFLDPYYKWSGCGVSGWDTNKLDKPSNKPAGLDENILPAAIRNL